MLILIIKFFWVYRGSKLKGKFLCFTFNIQTLQISAVAHVPAGGCVDKYFTCMYCWYIIVNIELNVDRYAQAGCQERQYPILLCLSSNQTDCWLRFVVSGFWFSRDDINNITITEHPDLHWDMVWKCPKSLMNSTIWPTAWPMTIINMNYPGTGHLNHCCRCKPFSKQFSQEEYWLCVQFRLLKQRQYQCHHLQQNSLCFWS